MNDNETFADFLKRCMDVADMTGAELASLSEIDPATISRLRKGAATPTVMHIGALAKVFHWSDAIQGRIVRRVSSV